MIEVDQGIEELRKMITLTATQELINNASGHTVSTNGQTLPTDGYFVGGVAPSLVTASTPTESQLSAYVDTFPFAEFVGIWTDSATSVVYVDVVEHYSGIGDALSAAAHRSEIAIWDVANSSEIRL